MVHAYTVVVHDELEEDGGGYWAEVEELPGCFAAGDTLQELDEDVRDAIHAYIGALEATGEPIPESSVTLDPGTRRWFLTVSLDQESRPLTTSEGN
jgi:predicted RNase H-like HicB family nuclease